MPTENTNEIESMETSMGGHSLNHEDCVLRAREERSMQVLKDERRVDALVAAVEKETSRACMVCGALAQTRSYAGYLLTLCAAHHLDVIGQDAVQKLAKPQSPRLPGSLSSSKADAS